MGGEKGAGFAHGCGLLGSPPRGRGKVAPVAVRPRWLWITPAWAGKSQMDETEFLRHWDHPRVGGEKTKKIP